MASTAVSMLACAVTTTIASRGASARSGSIRSSPESAPSRRSTSATSAGRRASAAIAEAADAASSTEWPIASRATRSVFRMFGSSSTIRTRMGGFSGREAVSMMTPIAAAG